MDSNLDKLMNILCAPATATVLLEAKLGLQLTRHHTSCSPGLTDI